jgi:hypothetical protein
MHVYDYSAALDRLDANSVVIESEVQRLAWHP